ncbi:hypothetical protein EON66_06310, partial [archaeon]
MHTLCRIADCFVYLPRRCRCRCCCCCCCCCAMRSMQACVCHVAAAALVALATAAPAWTPSTALFFESFNGVAESGLASFVKSSLAQYADQPVALHRALAAQNDSDLSLTLLQAAKRYAVTAPFAAPITVQDEPLVIQYDVALTEGLTCGGAYIKLLQATDNFQASETSPDSPYVIMFGPDRCGATDKVSGKRDCRYVCVG